MQLKQLYYNYTTTTRWTSKRGMRKCIEQQIRGTGRFFITQKILYEHHVRE